MTTEEDEVTRLQAELRRLAPNYDRNEQWRDRYESGETLREIAQSYDVDPTTVFRQLRKMGVDTSVRRPAKPKTPRGLLGWARHAD